MDLDFIPFFSTVEDSIKESVNENLIEEDNIPAPALLTDVPAPWLIYATEQDKDVRLPRLVRLHNEILMFCEYIAPTRHEIDIRDQVLNEVRQLVKNLWPTGVLHVFGSQMTRILTPTSDLDIVILNVPMKNQDDKDEMQNLLRTLAKRIEDLHIASYVEAIVNAKVPIVKFDHRLTGIPIDICINNDSGLKTGKLMRKFVRDYPPLRPLTIVLKLFLSQRGLNETFSGGIGSFVLSTLIISFIQQKIKLAKYFNVEPVFNLGCLLLDFFNLYGTSFNYFECGISIENDGKYVSKKKRKASSQGGGGGNQKCGRLYIENPMDPELDMGKGSFMLQKVKRAFEHASQLLTAALGDGNTPSYLSYVIRPDDPNIADRPGPDLVSAKSNSNAIQETEK
eukprot:gene13133-17600_t